jgi:hypothetical protein
VIFILTWFAVDVKEEGADEDVAIFLSDEERGRKCNTMASYSVPSNMSAVGFSC